MKQKHKTNITKTKEIKAKDTKEKEAKKSKITKKHQAEKGGNRSVTNTRAPPRTLFSPQLPPVPCIRPIQTFSLASNSLLSTPISAPSQL